MGTKLPDYWAGETNRYTKDAPARLYAIWQGRTFITVNNYFDDGYVVNYYGRSPFTREGARDAARVDINNYMKDVAAQYLEHFNIVVSERTLLGGSSQGAEYYRSAIDVCKGTVTTSNIDSLCTKPNPCTYIHVDDRSVGNNRELMDNTLIADFINSRPLTMRGSNTHKNVLWSAHRITGASGDNSRSFAESTGGSSAYIICRATQNRERRLIFALFHEINHTIGVHDHYHNIDGPCSGFCDNSVCNERNGTRGEVGGIYFNSSCNMGTDGLPYFLMNFCVRCRIYAINYLNRI
jgi:hypothetical protein